MKPPTDPPPPHGHGPGHVPGKADPRSRDARAEYENTEVDASGKRATPGYAGPHHYSPEELHNDDVAHEEADINIRSLVMFAVGLAVVVAGVAVLMYVLFWQLERYTAAAQAAQSPLAAPATDMPKTTSGSPFFGAARAPQLLTNEPANLIAQRNRELQALQGYGWVDQGAGVARIPIEEAKKLIVARGLPVRTDKPAGPYEGTSLPARGEASGGRVITNPPSAAAPAEAPAKPAPGGHTGH